MIEFIQDNNFLITLGAVIPAIVLFVVVALQGNKGINKMLFLLSSLAICAWAIVNYFSLITSGETQLIWARLVMLFAVLLTFVFLLFIKAFEKNKLDFKPLVLVVLSSLAIVAMLSSQTSQVFTSIEIINGQPIPTTGPLIPLFGIAIITFFVMGSFILIKNTSRSVGEKRLQFIYMSTGYFMMFALLIITQFIATVAFDNTAFIKFGPIFTLPFLVLTAYAILKHHLFSIKVIATEAFATGIVAFFVFNTLRSSDSRELIINIILLVFIIFFAIFLVRSVILEVKRREEIERLSRQLADFLRFGVHELRAPLGGIRGYTNMLIAGEIGQLNQATEKIMKIIQAQIDVLLLLVETFLNANRARTGNLEINLQEVELKDVMDNVINTQITSAELKGLKINVNIKNIPKVIADPQKVMIVFGNILSNSIKYSEKGTISISASHENNKVNIFFKDEGIGIPKNVLPHLFSRFERGTDRAKKMTTGSGIGLYLTKKIMLAMGGNINIDSAGIDKGTLVTVEFKPSKGKEIIKS